MNKQKLALFILLIVLALTVIWSFISAPRQKTINTPVRASGKSQQVENKEVDSATKSADSSGKSAVKPKGVSIERVLRLDLLEYDQSGFKGYRRNIFKPIFTDELSIMKQKVAAFKPVPVPPVIVAPPPVPPQPVLEQETIQSTLSHFTFLGFLKKDNRKTIFLAKDKEIVLVRKGETFAKRYEATAITDQALTIRVIDTGEEIVIPLAENRPLVAASRR